MLCLWLLNSGSTVASYNKVVPEYHLRFWEGQSASLLGCVFSQGTFYIACRSMAWILAHLQMWLMIPCLAQSLKCGSVLVLSSGWCRRRISSSVYNPTAPSTSVLPCRGGSAAKKCQILFIPLLSSVPCWVYVGVELALSDRGPVLPVKIGFPVPTSPCPESNGLLNCVQNWWLRCALLRSAVLISLKQGHLYAMRDRSTTNRTKAASELWRKYIVISLCKGTIKFCIEF